MNKHLSHLSLRQMIAAVMLLMLSTATAVAIERTSPSTADHSQFEKLQQSFETAPDVTQACISCHTEASKQLQKTTHWTLEYPHPETGQMLGKRHVINSFCGAAASNEPFCTSCHTGYGWNDMRLPPPTSENAVDCLICHDTTGDYKKSPNQAGHPIYEYKDPVDSSIIHKTDFANIAQNIGPTSSRNCGSCHFYGGGGDGVKHGDLDSSLLTAPRALDVHMSKDGAGFACADCHTSSAHSVTGSRYLTNARDTLGIDVPGHTDHTRASCESCHGNSPHNQSKLNDHVDQVACQTCHIPEFARGGVATKVWWDWSTAGQLDADGNPQTIYDSEGHLQYLSTKGTFRYGENVVPKYRWFDGVSRYTLREDKIDDTQTPIELNKIKGSHDNPDSRIWPFKIMEGKQPYDKVHKHLLVNHVYSADDDTALWTNFDWAKSLQAGTDYAGQEYSGEFDFIETRMHWPIAHMVAPAEDALTCASCHARDGRLAELTDFYMPGRDRNIWLDRAGWSLALLTLLGSLIHGTGRFVSSRRREK